MVGEQIKKYRKLNNLTQAELGNILNVSGKTISSWEANRTEPNMGMVEKLSNTFHCLKTDIIGRDNVDFLMISDYKEKQLIQMYRNKDNDEQIRKIFELLAFYEIQHQNKKEGDADANSKET